MMDEDSGAASMLLEVEPCGWRWDGRQMLFESVAALVDFWGISVSTYERTGVRLDWGDVDAVEAGWWAKHPGRRKTPVWISRTKGRLADLKNEGARQAEDRAAPEPERSAPAEALVEPFEVPAEGLDFAGQVAFQRRIVSAYADQLSLAIQGGRDITGLDRRYQSAAAHLRSMEKDLPKWAIESGSAWPRAEVMDALGGVLSGVNGGLDVLPHRLRRLLTLSPDQSEIVRAEVDQLRRLLHGLDYARPLVAEDFEPEPASFEGAETNIDPAAPLTP